MRATSSPRHYALSDDDRASWWDSPTRISLGERAFISTTDCDPMSLGNSFARPDRTFERANLAHKIFGGSKPTGVCPSSLAELHAALWTELRVPPTTEVSITGGAPPVDE